MTQDTPIGVGAEPLPPSSPGAGAPAPERRERLKAVFTQARGCTRCPQLVAGRTQVVFGSGNADADLMLVAEAPGPREDEQGTPLVGATGKLLAELLGSVGLSRDEVFVAHVLKCRPPGNRDPDPGEIDRCLPYLHEQIALIQPRVVCTLGDFATRLLADGDGITAEHGRARVATIGSRAVHLLPLLHPAAGLYSRSLLDELRADVAGLAELLARPAPPQPEPALVPDVEPEQPTEPAEAEVDVDVDEPAKGAEPEPEPEPKAPKPPDDPPQLGLF